MLEGMEGMDWYWLILMRCSRILGLLVVLVLSILGLASIPLWLLNKISVTISPALALLAII
jgi:hypothetical protein